MSRMAGLPRWRILVGRIFLFLRIKSSLVVICCMIVLLCVALVGQKTTWAEPKLYLDQVPQNSEKRRHETVQQGGISDLKMVGYEPKPRSLGHYFSRENEAIGVQRLDPYLKRRQTQKTVPLPEGATKAQIDLLDSHDYKYGMSDQFPPDNCVPLQDWQVEYHPSCNALHETDFFNLFREEDDENGRLIGQGHYRDVWLVKDTFGEKYALKTLRDDFSFDARNYDRHRRDALVAEQLKNSPSVIDIYSFCGNSGLFEYGGYGDLENVIFENESTYFDEKDLLIISLQVASAIADVHQINGQKIPSIAHADIAPAQFLLVDRVYKLTDFNRCRFISWNEKENKQCGFRVGNNPGNFRSPEEYKYEDETEKIDVYSMGNIFYSLLSRKWPFEEFDRKDVKEKVITGMRPRLPNKIQNSTSATLKAILNAAEMCWTYDPAERPSAREIANYLNDELKKLGDDIDP